MEVNVRISIIVLQILLLNTFLFASDKKHDQIFSSDDSINLSPDPFIQQIVNEVSADSILSYLQKFESFGQKNPGSAALVTARDWLYNKYQSYGYVDITYHDFTWSTLTLQNIIVNKPGTVYPDINLIIDGHYDTIVGPGTNDNGSGVAIILEVARLLANIDCEYTIKFINFSAEEEGLIGSRAYVDSVVVPQNMNILLVFNIDEVGGIAGYINNTITCERDEGLPAGNNAASAAYTDTLVTLTEMYSPLNTVIAHAYGSDYMPFEDAGYVITGYYETNESWHPHTLSDTLGNMDPQYVTEIARGALATAMYFAKAQNNLLVESDEKEIFNSYYLYPPNPNPFNPLTNLKYKINKPGFINISLFNTNGQMVSELVRGFHSRGTYHTIVDGTGLASGFYLVKMKINNFNTSRKILLVK